MSLIPKKQEAHARRVDILTRYKNNVQRLGEIEDKLYEPETLDTNQYDDLCNERRNLIILLDKQELEIRIEFNSNQYEELLTRFNI